MMVVSHETWALAAVSISVIGYVPYITSVLKGRTRPHVFTWFVWALMIGVVYVAQSQNGAGPGAWVMLLSCSVCSLITLLALFKGERGITRIDIGAFVLALLGIALWGVTGNPLLAVLLMMFVDFLAMVPTFRKTWYRPHEELAWLYGINVVRFILSIFALTTLSVVTVLPPIFMSVAEGALAMMIVYRRLDIMRRRKKALRQRIRRAA